MLCPYVVVQRLPCDRVVCIKNGNVMYLLTLESVAAVNYVNNKKLNDLPADIGHIWAPQGFDTPQTLVTRK